MKSFKLFISFFFLAQTAGTAIAAQIPFTLEEDHSLPLVYVNVALRHGSGSDPVHQSGITYFMGQMLLRGNQSRNKEQLDLAFDELGASVGVDVRNEFLVIRGAVLKQQLDPFLKLLADVITSPSFSEKEVTKLKSEVISELIEDLGNDRSLALKNFEGFLMGDHPFGKPIRGKRKFIEALSSTSVRAHYQKLFRSGDLFVLASGDTSQNIIEGFALALEGALPKGSSRAPLPPPHQPNQRRALLIDKPDRTQTQLYLGQIGIKLTDPQFFALHVANSIFGAGGFSSRLMQEIRVKKGWSYGASSDFRFGTQPRYWYAYTFPAQKDTPAAVKRIVELIEAAKSNGVTADEFDFAVNSLVNSAAFMNNTPQRRMENVLLEKALDLPAGFMRGYADNIKKLTLAQVNQALANFLRPESLQLAIVGTAKDLKEPLATALGVKPEEVVVKAYTEE